MNDPAVPMDDFTRAKVTDQIADAKTRRQVLVNAANNKFAPVDPKQFAKDIKDWILNVGLQFTNPGVSDDFQAKRRT